MKIQIVEDDKIIRDLIAKRLEVWGYQVYKSTDFIKVLEDFKREKPDLVILDVSLPYFNGYHWCQEIRKISKLPILFVSSSIDNMNIIMAMNLGADDYITKPFDIEVLEAKIQALMRRAYDFVVKLDDISFGGITLYRGEMQVEYQGQAIELSKNEYLLLEELLKAKGDIVSRDDLMQKLWDSDQYIDDNTLTVNINRLRKRLDEIGIGDCIKTKKGAGYYVRK